MYCLSACVHIMHMCDRCKGPELMLCVSNGIPLCLLRQDLSLNQSSLTLLGIASQFVRQYPIFASQVLVILERPWLHKLAARAQSTM